MGDKTGIGWTEATWNPVVGCSIVSAGCTNCYAMKQAGRMVRMNPETHYQGTVKDTKAGAVWTGVMKEAPASILHRPLAWARPRVVFVNSMSDLFHEDVPDEWIDKVFAVMALAPRHTFQILTKRAERMKAYMEGVTLARLMKASEGMPAPAISLPAFPLPNVWLGVSAEDQRAADARVPALLQTPAAIRFVSYEPAIGPIDFEEIQRDADTRINALSGYEATRFLDDTDVDRIAKLDWVIIGGESHQQRDKARTFHVQWARDAVRACREAGVAVFMKQLGSNPIDTSDAGTFPVRLSHRKGEDQADWPESIRVQEYPGTPQANGATP